MADVVRYLHNSNRETAEKTPVVDSRHSETDVEKWSWGKAIGFMCVVSCAAWLGFLAMVLI